MKTFQRPTLADAIRAEDLRKPGQKPSEIAFVCQCTPEYVRIVLRQRAGGRRSAADNKYAKSKKGKATDVASRAALKEWRRTLRETTCPDLIKQAQRAAYKQARREGLTKYRAAAKAWAARAEMIRHHGDKEAAAKAAQVARVEARSRVLASIQPKDAADDRRQQPDA